MAVALFFLISLSALMVGFIYLGFSIRHLIQKRKSAEGAELSTKKA